MLCFSLHYSTPLYSLHTYYMLLYCIVLLNVYFLFSILTAVSCPRTVQRFAQTPYAQQ